MKAFLNPQSRKTAAHKTFNLIPLSFLFPKQPSGSNCVNEATGSITEIYAYPIKSGAAVPLSSSRITALGLATDRQWLIVDDTGRFQTQRQIPHLVWIAAKVSGDKLILSAPNQPVLELPLANEKHAKRTVTVWRDTLPAIDMGDAASQWLQDFLQIPGRVFHLVQFDPSQERLSDPNWTGQQAAAHQFADGFAINVLSQSALDAFNERLLEYGLPVADVRRFRPNLVLGNVPAHQEDRWRYLTIQTDEGPVELELVKPCPRCQIPNIDPETSIADEQVSELLAQYRRLEKMDGAVCFGVNAVVRSGAGRTIRCGDTYTAT
jgi:uncharacterized protein